MPTAGAGLKFKKGLDGMVPPADDTACMLFDTKSPIWCRTSKLGRRHPLRRLRRDLPERARCVGNGREDTAKHEAPRRTRPARPRRSRTSSSHRADTNRAQGSGKARLQDLAARGSFFFFKQKTAYEITR